MEVFMRKPSINRGFPLPCLIAIENRVDSKVDHPLSFGNLT
jgi:hypothetical protein